MDAPKLNTRGHPESSKRCYRTANGSERDNRTVSAKIERRFDPLAMLRTLTSLLSQRERKLARGSVAAVVVQTWLLHHSQKERSAPCRFLPAFACRQLLIPGRRHVVV